MKLLQLQTIEIPNRRLFNPITSHSRRTKDDTERKTMCLRLLRLITQGITARVFLLAAEVTSPDHE